MACRTTTREVNDRAGPDRRTVSLMRAAFPRRYSGCVSIFRGLCIELS
jgi:hypothetical protein